MKLMKQNQRRPVVPRSRGRGGRRRLLVAAIAVPVLVVVGAVALWPRAAAPTVPAGAGIPSHHSGLHVELLDVGAVAAAGTPITPPPAGSIGSHPETSLAAAGGAAPRPERRGATGLGTPRAPTDPDDVIGDSALGGCHPAYGLDGQCLPVIPPSMAGHAADMIDAGLDPADMDHVWSCDEVRDLFPDGVAVRVSGVDPEDLDDDGDDIACEPGG